MGVNIGIRPNGRRRARLRTRACQAYYIRRHRTRRIPARCRPCSNQLQTYFGKPGDDGSLDTAFGSFQNSLQALGTSPDDFATRATVVSKAQSLAATDQFAVAEYPGRLRQSTETPRCRAA